MTWYLILGGALILLLQVFYGLEAREAMRRKGYEKGGFWDGFFLGRRALLRIYRMEDNDDLPIIDEDKHFNKIINWGPRKHDSYPSQYGWNYKGDVNARGSTEEPKSPEADPAHEDRLLRSGGWKCACGRVHAGYVFSCSCGRNKDEI